MLDVKKFEEARQQLTKAAATIVNVNFASDIKKAQDRLNEALLQFKKQNESAMN